MKFLWTYDPGKKTGWSQWGLETGELLDWGEVPYWLLLDTQMHSGDEVVYESFTYRHPSTTTVSLQVIGVILYLCEKRQITPIPQPPGIISGVSKWPLYTFSSIPSEHTRDAIKHGIIYFRKRGLESRLPKEFLVGGV